MKKIYYVAKISDGACVNPWLLEMANEFESFELLAVTTSSRIIKSVHDSPTKTIDIETEPTAYQLSFSLYESEITRLKENLKIMSSPDYIKNLLGKSYNKDNEYSKMRIEAHKKVTSDNIALINKKLDLLKKYTSSW